MIFVFVILILHLACCQKTEEKSWITRGKEFVKSAYNSGDVSTETGILIGIGIAAAIFGGCLIGICCTIVCFFLCAFGCIIKRNLEYDK